MSAGITPVQKLTRGLLSLFTNFFLHGPYRIIHKSDELLGLQRYMKNGFVDLYHNVVTAMDYLVGKSS